MFEIIEMKLLSPAYESEIRSLHKLCQLEIKKDIHSLGQELFLDPTLNSHEGTPAYFCAKIGQTVVGFAFVFCPMAHEIEVTAFVHPEHRRCGIFEALLSSVCKTYKPLRVEKMLLVNDRASQTGLLVADAMQCQLNHSEFAMKHNRNQTDWRQMGSRLKVGNLRLAEMEHMQRITEIRAGAFEMRMSDAEHMVQNAMSDTLRSLYVFVSEPEAELVGVSGVKIEPEQAYIFGLAIDPTAQGRGYGKALVYALLDGLYERGVETICLDVDSVNERAYELYKACGFEACEVVDYFISTWKC